MDSPFGRLMAITALGHAPFHVFVMAVSTVDSEVFKMCHVGKGDTAKCRRIGHGFWRFLRHSLGDSWLRLSFFRGFFLRRCGGLLFGNGGLFFSRRFSLFGEGGSLFLNGSHGLEKLGGGF
jgi:hypothetical protein